MITPIGTMTIDQIHERKNDLLFGIDDVKALARNEWNTALDEFSKRLFFKSEDSSQGMVHIAEIMEIYKELMKGE